MSIVRVLLLSIVFMPISCTSTYSAGKKAYSEETFPNPKTNFTACGQTRKSYICDPAKVLSPSQVERLSSIILSLKDTKTCLCDRSRDCHRVGRHEILVAVVPRIQYVTGTFPDTYSAQVQAARVFAEHLRDTKWRPESKFCTLGAIIVHDVYTKVTWTATNYFAHKVITDKRAADTVKDVKDRYFKRGNVYGGLLDMLTSYKGFLDAGKPLSPRLNWWQNMLIALGVFGGVGLLFFIRHCRGTSKSSGGVWVSGTTHSSHGGGGGGCGGGGGGCGGGGGG